MKNWMRACQSSMVRHWRRTSAQHRRRRSDTITLKQCHLWLLGQVPVLLFLRCHHRHRQEIEVAVLRKWAFPPPPPASPSGYMSMLPWQSHSCYPQEYTWMKCELPGGLDCRYWTVIPNDGDHMFPGSWTLWWYWKTTDWGWRWMKLPEYLKKMNIDNI